MPPKRSLRQLKLNDCLFNSKKLKPAPQTPPRHSGHLVLMDEDPQSKSSLCKQLSADEKRELISQATEKRISKTENNNDDTKAEEKPTLTKELSDTLPVSTSDTLDSFSGAVSSPESIPLSDEDSSQFWDNKSSETPAMGTDMQKLKVFKVDKKPLVASKQSNHRILFNIDSLYNPANAGSCPSPHPIEFVDRWDDDHVKMACSSQNKYPRGKQLVSKWSDIEKSLRGLISDSVTSYDIEEAILSYNSRNRKDWDFEVLHYVINKELNKDESRYYLQTVLPRMVKLALALPHLVTAPLPLFKKGKPAKVTMTQQQASCLLANAFFCTFPRRNYTGPSSDCSDYPTINFNSLFGPLRQPKDHRKIEKVKCLLNYFSNVTENPPTGILTFERKVLPDSVNWEAQSGCLGDLSVSAAGTIEDDGTGCLEVDFANKYMGGGALDTGLVQEEIRFMICPELILSRLLCQVLLENESVWITGIERFSDYTGYANTFQWSGLHKDTTLRDNNRRFITTVVAIDAIRYHDTDHQFLRKNIDRELQKALVGFGGPSRKSPYQRRSVATGNWGCGAFRGNLELKSLIQLLAASVAKRNVLYFTFGDSGFQHKLHEMHKFLQEHKTPISHIYNAMIRYNDLLRIKAHVFATLSKASRSTVRCSGLFEFVKDFLTERKFVTEIENWEKEVERLKEEQRRLKSVEEDEEERKKSFSLNTLNCFSSGAKKDNKHKMSANDNVHLVAYTDEDSTMSSESASISTKPKNRNINNSAIDLNDEATEPKSEARGSSTLEHDDKDIEELVNFYDTSLTPEICRGAELDSSTATCVSNQSINSTPKVADSTSELETPTSPEFTPTRRTRLTSANEKKASEKPPIKSFPEDKQKRVSKQRRKAKNKKKK